MEAKDVFHVLVHDGDTIFHSNELFWYWDFNLLIFNSNSSKALLFVI